MTVRSLHDITTDHQDLSSVICVIGAGIAGLVLAERLSKNNRKVIVLESGGQASDATVDELNHIEDADGRYTRAITGRFRGLGGTSSRWGGRMIPISEHEFAPRPYLDEAGWALPLGGLQRYHREIEELFSIGHGSFEEIDQRRARNGEMFSPNAETFHPRWAKCPSFKRCNVSTVLKQEINTRENFEVWLDATVCDFGLDREAGRLRSVTARTLDGKTLTVKADHFVVAAGTIETTRLLLLMDQASDLHAFRQCNALGRYFQDHLKAQVAVIDRREAVATNRMFGYRYIESTRRDLHLELSQAAQRSDAVSSAFAYVSMDLETSPLNAVKKLAHGIQRRQVQMMDMLQVSKNLGLIGQAAYWRLRHRQLFVPADVDFRLLLCAEQLPSWKNRIRLSEKPDRFGVPKAQLEWAPTQADERTFRSAIDKLGAYWKHSGLDRICPLIWSAASQNRAVPIVDQAEACAHPSGSTRMGTDPAESVVGPDLRCHAIPNVAVASASVFPTAGSANPTFTIMKLALWLADSYLLLPL